MTVSLTPHDGVGGVRDALKVLASQQTQLALGH